MILAHNYQVPEVQDVAHYVGDSLGLSQQAAKAEGQTIVFCGVHFMAETASILCPDKTVLIPDLDAGCSLADSITPEQLRAWQAKHPGRGDGHVRQHDGRGQGADRLLRDVARTRSTSCATSSRRTGRTREILFGPDMFLGAYVEKELGRQAARVGRRVPRPRRHPPVGHRRDARRAPGRRLPHPPRVRLLDLGHGVRRRRRRRRRGRAHALDRRDARLRRAGRARLDGDHGHRGRDAAPAAHGRAAGRLHRRQRARELPLHEDDHARRSCATRCARCATRSRSPEDIAERARVPIERMVAISA